MAQNPYQPPSSVVDSGSDRYASAFPTLLISCFAPFCVAFALYIPFRLVASHLNNCTYAHSDDFCYPIATATWPFFTCIVGATLSYSANRLRLSFAWRLVATFVGSIALFFTGSLDPWIGLYDGGQNGFLQWPANFKGFSTPKLSVALIIPAYLLGWALGLLLPTSVRR